MKVYLEVMNYFDVEANCQYFEDISQVVEDLEHELIVTADDPLADADVMILLCDDSSSVELKAKITQFISGKETDGKQRVLVLRNRVNDPGMFRMKSDGTAVYYGYINRQDVLTCAFCFLCMSFMNTFTNK